MYSDKKGISLKCTSKLQSTVPLKSSSIPDSIHFLRKCSQCNLHNILDEKSLTWEAMDFCNEDCLSKYFYSHESENYERRFTTSTFNHL